jgi:hypothetical protein
MCRYSGHAAKPKHPTENRNCKTHFVVVDRFSADPAKTADHRGRIWQDFGSTHLPVENAPRFGCLAAILPPPTDFYAVHEGAATLGRLP